MILFALQSNNQNLSFDAEFLKLLELRDYIPIFFTKMGINEKNDKNFQPKLSLYQLD